MPDDIIDVDTEGFPHEREERQWHIAEQTYTQLQHILQNQEDAIQRLDVMKANLEQRTARLAALTAKLSQETP